MLGVVEPEAPHRPDILRGQRRQEEPDVGHLVRHLVPAEDVPGDDVGVPGLGDVRHAPGQDGIAVVGASVLGEEADKTLRAQVGILSVSGRHRSRAAQGSWLGR